MGDNDGLKRLRLRLLQILASTITVLATLWLCTFGAIPAILALMVAKHVLVAILIMGPGRAAALENPSELPSFEPQEWEWRGAEKSFRSAFAILRWVSPFTGRQGRKRRGSHDRGPEAGGGIVPGGRGVAVGTARDVVEIGAGQGVHRHLGVAQGAQTVGGAGLVRQGHDAGPLRGAGAVPPSIHQPLLPLVRPRELYTTKPV